MNATAYTNGAPPRPSVEDIPPASKPANDAAELFTEPALLVAARTALEAGDVAGARAALAAVDDVVNAPDVRERKAARLERQAANDIAGLGSAPTVDDVAPVVASSWEALDAAERLIVPTRRTLADVMAGPPKPVPWLCQGLGVVRGRPTMLLGYPGAGKTYAQVSAAVAWALDKPAWGCADFRAVRPLRVLYVDIDMGHEAAEERLRATVRGFGLSPAEIADVADVVTVEYDVGPLRLGGPDAADIGAFRRAWARAVRGFDLAIVDSYRGALIASGIDENGTAAAVVAAEWSRVSRDTGVAFWACRHAGKDPVGKGQGQRSPEQTGSGSAAIDGASGAKLLMQLDPKITDRDRALQAPRYVSMVRDAARLGARPYEPHYLALEQGDDAGEPWVRCVYRTVEQVHPPEGDDAAAAERDARAAADALTVLRHAAKLAAKGQTVGGVDAVVALLQARRARAVAAVDHLFANGWITARKGAFGPTPEGRAHLGGER